VQIENSLNIRRIELRHAMALTLIGRSMNGLIGRIGNVCIPPQIAQSAIRRVAIGKVARFHVGWAWTDKCLKNQSMYKATADSTIGRIQCHLKPSRLSWHMSAQDERLFPSAIRREATKGADRSLIANLIQAFESQNSLPSFNVH
jgi:hypothetical protein